MKLLLVPVLILFGLIEFLVRIVLVLLLTVSILGILLLVDEIDMEDFFTPVCFTLASDLLKSAQHPRDVKPQLSKKQLADLEYQRRELEIKRQSLDLDAQHYALVMEKTQ